MRDKQAHPRQRARVMVRYGEHGPDRTAFTMNVSLSGAFIRTNNVFRPGMTIHVQLELPSQTYTHAAQVVWAKKVPAQLAHTLSCGMGVRFLNPADDWPTVFAEWRSTK